jgi:F0F1-type ATP synthase assembly protein I
MQNRQTKRNQNTSNRIERNLLFALYSIFMVVNIVFATTGGQWAVMNIIAGISVGLALWYLPEK